jgi:hypothetical protein
MKAPGGLGVDLDFTKRHTTFEQTRFFHSSKAARRVQLDAGSAAMAKRLQFPAHLVERMPAMSKEDRPIFVDAKTGTFPANRYLSRRESP